jgi:surface antigen
MRVSYGHKMPAMDFGSPRFSSRHGGAAMLHSAMFMSYKHGFSKTGKARYAMRGGYSYGYGGLQCVPFARAASGIELKGNAALWWDAAAGVYQRGSRPEPGSVLNFRSTGHMRLGHVAVVAAVINSREIEVDHANWAGSYGGVSRGVAVQDVSEANDWSEVRVAMGHNGEFGSVYPTYGFIYDRPDNGGTMIASETPRRMAPIMVNDEVAEAPAHPRMPRVYHPGRAIR